MNAHRFHLRTDFLPDSRQSYLHLPGIRPDRGPCPSCGATEELYCAVDCDLIDPHAHDTVARLRRCLACSLMSPRYVPATGVTLLLVHRGVRHLLRAGELDRSLCHRARADAKGALLIPGVPW